MDLSTGWASLGNGSFSGSIPVFSVSSLAAQIIAIQISASNAKATWYTGGWLDQKVLTDLETTPFITFSQKLHIGGNIIFFSEPIDNYSIDISFPTYFTDVNVALWKYVP